MYTLSADRVHHGASRGGGSETYSFLRGGLCANCSVGGRAIDFTLLFGLP